MSRRGARPSSTICTRYSKRADGSFIGTLGELEGVLQSVAGHQNVRAARIDRWGRLLEKFGRRAGA